MALWIFSSMVLLHGIIGCVLSEVAYRHLRNPRQSHSAAILFKPEQFRPEGERWRRIALRYWYLGTFTIILVCFFA